MRLNVTTTSGCRGKCVYCPQDEYQHAANALPRYLTPAELRELRGNLGRRFDEISFGGFSEPFDNPDLVELLEIARTLTDRISIYTIGDLVDRSVVDRMAHVPIDRFDVSCHGFEPRVYERTRPFVDPRRVRENLLYLFEHRDHIRKLVVSVTGPFGSDEARAELAELCHRYRARLDLRDLHSRAGLLRIRRRKQAAGPFRCRKDAFEKPVLVPGGGLVLCCQDFGMRTQLGNLHDQSFDEILATSPARRHVLAVAAGQVRDPSLACYECEFCELEAEQDP